MNATPNDTDAVSFPRLFAQFHTGYVACALWASADDEGTPLDELGLELSEDAANQLRADCVDFFNAHRDTYNDAGWGDDQAGHDFWLTRNGHGAGFWDRGLGEVGKMLTRDAKAYGSCDLYVGDDGKIYAQ